MAQSMQPANGDQGYVPIKGFVSGKGFKGVNISLNQDGSAIYTPNLTNGDLMTPQIDMIKQNKVAVQKGGSYPYMHSTGNSVFEKIPGKSDNISEGDTNSVTNYSKNKDTAFGYGADSGLPPRAFRQGSNTRQAKKKSKLPSLMNVSPRNGHKVQHSQDFGRNHQRKVKHNQDTILAGYDTENQDNHQRHFNFTYEDGFAPRGGKYETAS